MNISLNGVGIHGDSDRKFTSQDGFIVEFLEKVLYGNFLYWVGDGRN